jgi:hypothetical protein
VPKQYTAAGALTARGDSALRATAAIERLILNLCRPGRKSGDLPDSVRRLFRLDPADQVVPADGVQQGRMVGGHVAPDHPDHLIIAIAAGHEPAFASDQLHPRASYPGCLPQRNARMLA